MIYQTSDPFSSPVVREIARILFGPISVIAFAHLLLYSTMLCILCEQIIIFNTSLREKLDKLDNEDDQKLSVIYEYLEWHSELCKLVLFLNKTYSVFLTVITCTMIPVMVVSRVFILHHFISTKRRVIF